MIKQINVEASVFFFFPGGVRFVVVCCFFGSTISLFKVVVMVVCVCVCVCMCLCVCPFSLIVMIYVLIRIVNWIVLFYELIL